MGSKKKERKKTILGVNFGNFSKHSLRKDWQISGVLDSNDDNVDLIFRFLPRRPEKQSLIKQLKMKNEMRICEMFAIITCDKIELLCSSRAPRSLGGPGAELGNEIPCERSEQKILSITPFKLA